MVYIKGLHGALVRFGEKINGPGGDGVIGRSFVIRRHMKISSRTKLHQQPTWRLAYNDMNDLFGGQSKQLIPSDHDSGYHTFKSTNRVF